MESPEDTALNDSQQRRLIVTCQYVNRLLSELEHLFIEAQSHSPFGRYVNDLAPAEQRLVQDYITRIRSHLVRVLAGQNLPPTPQRTGVRWSILTHLEYVDVAVEELKPHYMRGYGAVAPAAGAALNGIVEELHGTIGQLTSYLEVDRTEDLRKRLERIVGAAVRSTLEDYAAVLRRWSLNNLAEIRAEWAATTDALRADLDRQLGHAHSTSVSPEEVRHDLERLNGTAVR